MRVLITSILVVIPVLLMGQQFDLTGRLSVRTQNVSYDESSDIKPDSIGGKSYSKSSLVPGWQQLLNIALFGRTENMDLTLLADLKNTEWTGLKFSDMNSISRLTLDVRLSRHQFVIGDFFESSAEAFMQSREIRGGKYSIHVDDLFGKNSFIDFTALGGIVQKAVNQGAKLQDLYKQYETSGQYRRVLGTGRLTFGKSGLFDISVNYLSGKDQKSSIDTSINVPLENNLLGGQGNLYFWNRNIRLFGEYFTSQLDSLNYGKNSDNSYNFGFDLRYQTFKLVLLYQRVGLNYYTAGYPFLETDKKGIKGQIGYLFPQSLSISSEFELYDDNLESLTSTPTTKTKIFDFGITTFFSNWPEFSLKYGIRLDESETRVLKIDDQEVSIKTDKKTARYEGGIGYRFNNTRLSLSGIYLDLVDQSLLSAGDPLGTDQFIVSFNFYTTGAGNFFMSGGAVYSKLEMTDNRTNDNFFIYESNRWDIIPQRVKLENTLTYIINDAANGGIADLLSDYNQINGEISLEYFFNNFVSFKLVVGTEVRQFKYSTEDALEIIAMDEYGPTYFNLNESYSGLTIGGEFNWIF